VGDADGRIIEQNADRGNLSPTLRPLAARALPWIPHPTGEMGQAVVLNGKFAPRLEKACRGETSR
jgi:hypothetical protein